MTVPYTLLKQVIMAEIALVILIILLAYTLKYYFYLKARNDKHKAEKIESYLKSFSSSNIQLNEFPKAWQKLDIILPVINKLDQTSTNPNWTHLKQSIANNILLPIARKKFNSRRWINRLLSAQCFELSMDNKDETIVGHLLEDKIPLVHMHAAIAAINFGSMSMINFLISNISKKRRLGQAIYLKIFAMAPPGISKYIEERLKFETDLYTRATCYKILLSFPANDSHLDTTVDIDSDNLELRISALKYMAHAYKERAIPLLINLLSDKSWEIRAVSNRLLGDLHAIQAINEISKSLKDPIWWVRVNAADALKNLGEAGIQVLNEQDPNVDLFAYQTAMHVLNKPTT